MSAKPNVLVTRRWPAAVEARLAENFNAEFNRADTPMSHADFREALKKYDAILPTVTDKLDVDVSVTLTNGRRYKYTVEIRDFDPVGY